MKWGWVDIPEVCKVRVPESEVKSDWDPEKFKF